MNNYFPSNMSIKHIVLVFTLAFLTRGFTFHYFIAPNYRYNQPDTKDYHICAISLAEDRGMSYYKSNRPIFWRTPGYPILLLPFYKFFGINGYKLENYRSAHHSFLWLQILLTSFLPILIFYLAQLLINNTIIAWIATILSIFHLGFVLSSTYLMTDALSTLFFLLFLFFIFKVSSPSINREKNKNNYLNEIIRAAICLSIMTWMRPMGLYLGILGFFLILMSPNLKNKFKQAFLFSLIFYGSLSPWYLRNYDLTGSLFFCPLWGPYVLTFLVPKIYQRINGGPLVPCINKFLREAKIAYEKDLIEKQIVNSPYVTCKELLCSEIARPWIRKYPLYFALDWSIEVFKTLCDLYSYHLINFSRNMFDREPPVEFLREKLEDCLYREKMPKLARVITLIDAIIHFLILLGILGGFLLFMIKPLFKQPISSNERERFMRWMKCGIFIALVIGMTGGFGYARLRLPIEALMIILALDFWFWLALNWNTYDKKIIRPLASELF